MTKELNSTQRDQLTSLQHNQLVEQYVELVVDNMDTKDLVRYAIDGMIEYFNEGSLDELREEINTFDEELFDELVDNVTQQYPKQLNTFDEERYIQALMKEVN